MSRAGWRQAVDPRAQAALDAHAFLDRVDIDRKASLRRIDRAVALENRKRHVERWFADTMGVSVEAWGVVERSHRGIQEWPSAVAWPPRRAVRIVVSVRAVIGVVLAAVAVVAAIALAGLPG